MRRVGVRVNENIKRETYPREENPINQLLLAKMENKL